MRTSTAAASLCYYHSDLLGVVEGGKTDAVLNENGEILHFHHRCPEKEEKRAYR